MTSTGPQAVPARTTTNGAAVRTRLETVTPAARAAMAALCAHPRISDIYPEMLHVQLDTVRAMVPLLRTAEQEAVRRAAAADAVASGVITYVRRAAREGRDHGDRLLDDYAALDLDPAGLLERPPSPIVAAMVGATYYWILHYHPVAIVGYLAAIEAASSPPELIAELQRRTEHPASAFRTLAQRASSDVAHGNELWDLLDVLPLTTTHVAVVTTVALHTVDRHVAALRHLIAERPSLAEPERRQNDL